VLVDTVVSFSLYVRTPSITFPEITNINPVVMEYNKGWIDIHISGTGLVDYNGTSFDGCRGETSAPHTAKEVQHY